MLLFREFGEIFFFYRTCILHNKWSCMNLSQLCKPDTINHDIASKSNQIKSLKAYFDNRGQHMQHINWVFYLFGLKTLSVILHNRVIFSDIMCFNDAEKLSNDPWVRIIQKYIYYRFNCYCNYCTLEQLYHLLHFGQLITFNNSHRQHNRFCLHFILRCLYSVITQISTW